MPCMKEYMFRLISRYDPELAEDFNRRLPVGLNHTQITGVLLCETRSLSQDPEFAPALMALVGASSLHAWRDIFENRVLPILMRKRLSPCSDYVAAIY